MGIPDEDAIKTDVTLAKATNYPPDETSISYKFVQTALFCLPGGYHSSAVEWGSLAMVRAGQTGEAAKWYRPGMAVDSAGLPAGSRRGTGAAQHGRDIDSRKPKVA